jgi:anti-anti-sigma regulatory factor
MFALKEGLVVRQVSIREDLAQIFSAVGKSGSFALLKYRRDEAIK